MPISTTSGSCPSPPPSPSRNSIFDQSWLVEAGPNIASAYPKRSQSSIFVPLPLSPSSGSRHEVVAKGTAPGPKAQKPAMTLSPVSGSSSSIFGSLNTRETSSNLLQRPPTYSSSSSSITHADSERIQGTSGHRHWKPSDMWTTAAVVSSPLTTTTTAANSTSPSATIATTSTTTTSTTATSPVRRPSYLCSKSTLSLKLLKDKASFLGNGRHAEVYKGLIHRLSQGITEPSLSAAATSSESPESEHVHASILEDMSSSTPSSSSYSIMTSWAPQTPVDLASLAPLSLSSQQSLVHQQPHQQQNNPTTNHSTEQQCAVKCLFADDESQQVGWTEALVLQSLQASEIPHPGRAHIVGLLGVYDQATHSGFASDDVNSFAFHQARLDRISSSPASNLHTQMVPKEMEPEWALLLEYCPQGSLWDWVQRHPEQVGLQLWLSWAIQLAQAVDFIHSEHIVHHDIKPHNIMLTSLLEAKLSDFGAGRRIEDPSLGLTDGLGRGTPPYSAPEIFHMNKTYSYPIDIYSLGVTLYVAGLTAQEPFSKLKSVVEMMVWVKKGGFWQWEEQGWIHDRGPVPKKTSLSQASVSSAAAAAAASASVHHSQALSQLEARSGPYTQGRLWGSLSNSSLSSVSSLSESQQQHVSSHPSYQHHNHHALPPLNTHGLSVVTQQPTPGPLTSPMMSSFPASPQEAFRPQSTSSAAMHLAAPSGAMPSPVLQISTTVSPPSSCPSSPLPQPMSPALGARKDTYPHQVYHSLPRSRPPSQQSLSELGSTGNGTVWRFLNGEPVDGAIIALLKAMCHPDPQQRPTAAQVVAQLEEIQDRLLLTMQCDY